MEITIMQTPEIDPISVENADFLIDRLHRDCSPMQYIRELCKNSLEAVEMAMKAG